MMHSPRPEKDRIKKELAEQIKQYQANGGKIDVRQPGESVMVDMTNGWKEGFSINDNVGFGKKTPRVYK